MAGTGGVPRSAGSRCSSRHRQFERKDEQGWPAKQRAKAICATCPVREPCLAYALRIREPHGIWGGLSEVERRPGSMRPIA